MDFENSKTPQEMAKIKKERAISDAELLKDGAEYEIDSQGNEILSATNKQVENARKEMEEDLGGKGIEKKLESMTSEEREFYDHSMNYGNLLEENRVLLREGKISQEQFSNIMKGIQDLGSSRNKALREKIGNKKVSEIIDLSGDQRDANITEMMQNAKSFDDLYKAMRRNYDIKFSDGTSKNPNYFVDVIERVKKGELNINHITRTGGLRNKVEELLKNGEQKANSSENENGTIKRENKKEKPEEIFEEIIKNPKMEAIFKRETENPGKRQRIYDSGTDEYKDDLKRTIQMFLLKFPTKESFEAKEKYGEDADKAMEKVKAEIDSGRNVKFNENILKGIEMRKIYEKGEHGWESSFGEAYEESLKEFSQLLYEGVEKYQKEKTKKTEQCIADAKSFEDLNNAIKASGGIQGSQEFFKPKVLADLIEKLRKGSKTINAITSSFGLRQKVDELLKLEKVREKINS